MRARAAGCSAQLVPTPDRIDWTQPDGTPYTLTGPCTKLAINGGDNKVKADSVVKATVTGSKNTVEIDAVDRIAVTGNDNSVTYKRGVSGKPKAAAVGGNNKLNQGS